MKYINKIQLKRWVQARLALSNIEQIQLCSLSSSPFKTKSKVSETGVKHLKNSKPKSKKSKDFMFKMSPK
jgi:hypothetical protein